MQEFDRGGRTRRSFVQAGAVVSAGLGAQALKAQSRETLALSGGPKAVTFPPEKTAAILKWPRYGAEEKKAVADLPTVTAGTPKFPRSKKSCNSIWVRRTSKRT